MTPTSRAPETARLADDRNARLPSLVAAIVPSLAAAVTAGGALWLSAAAIVSLFLTALLAALLVRRVAPAVGSLVVLLACAVLAGAADIAAAAWLPAVRADLGIYLPLAVLLTSGPVAAAVLGDTQPNERARRATLRALEAGLAFLGSVGVTALVREALGAGTITLPGAASGRLINIPGIAAAPAEGLLSPFAALIAAGYLAGFVVLLVRRRARRSAPGDAP
jgi:Na+-translocating ferredoxin:NAD+ oxidoreductase RnfE subunit